MSTINQYIKSPISGIIKKISDLEKNTQKQIKRMNRKIDNIKGPQGPQGSSNGGSGDGIPNAGVISFEPYLTEFGSVTPNSSKKISVSLRNISLSSITINSIITDGDFPLTYSGIDFPVTIPSGTSISLEITFTPTEIKEYSAHLYLYDTITLSPGILGTGAVSGNSNNSFNLSPTTFDYGNVVVGQSLTKSITVTNESSTESVTINNIITGSEYVTVAQAVPFTISDGGTKTVDFDFKPPAPAIYSGTIQVSDTKFNIKTADWTGVGVSQFLQERMWDGEISNPSGSHSESYVVIAQDGNTIVVGDNANTGTINPYTGTNEYKGTLYVYIKVSGMWTLQTTIQLETGIDDDIPIYSISISGDGNTLAIGGIESVHIDNIWTIWLYTRSGSAWTLSQKITDVDLTGAHFGRTIALSSNGLNLAIGSGSGSGTGFAWIYTLSGTWSKQQMFSTSFEGSDSITLSSDGNILVIGSSTDDSNAGAAFSYIRTGSTWSTAQKITMIDSIGESHFGLSISISADGKILAVGGPDDDNSIGAVLIYTYSSSGNIWEFYTKLVSTGYRSYSKQGNSVSLSSDGSKLIIGGYHEDNNLGAASIIWNNSEDAWSLIEKIVGNPNDNRFYQGTTVSVSGDGSIYALSTSVNVENGYNSVWIFY